MHDACGSRSFYVTKAARGKRVGTLLMDAALAFAIDAGYDALSLYVFRALTAAIQLYRRYGFFIAAQCACIQTLTIFVIHATVVREVS